MGIIQQQTIKGTFYSYLGVFVGFVTLNFLQPHALTSEQIGLIGILTSFSQMFAQFSILGFNATGRYFPYFRNRENHHNGYLSLASIVSLVGFTLFSVLIYVFKDQLINQEAQKSTLFSEYFWYLLPLTFFTLIFNVFDLYARMLYDTTTGRILREFTKRLFILMAVLLIFFKLVNFNSFIGIWLLANILPAGIMAMRLINSNEFSLKPNFQFLNKDVRKMLIRICSFAILTGSAPIIVENIDKYMINEKFGLGDTGVYTIAYYFGMVISLPARSLYSIAYTVVSESWKNNDLSNIKNIYEKSCINQLWAALFIFLIIWANVDNIFKLLPPEFERGKYVIFFIGVANVIDSATGINGVIVTTSKHFKYDSLFYLALIGVTIIANLILIPLYGITGAAIAAAITFLAFNLFRYLFILFLYKMQPFTVKSPLLIITAVCIYYLNLLIPPLANFVWDTIIRTGIITTVYLVANHFLHFSTDIRSLLNNYLRKYIP